MDIIPTNTMTTEMTTAVTGRFIKVSAIMNRGGEYAPDRYRKLNGSPLPLRFCFKFKYSITRDPCSAFHLLKRSARFLILNMGFGRLKMIGKLSQP
jgi:hypothetical protein